MTIELLTPFLAPFIFALLFQMFLCFKTRKGILKALPLIIDLLAFFYSGARFFGIIRYTGDEMAIYDGALTDGIFISIMAFTGLIGIVFAWLIYCLIGRRKVRNIRS